MNESEKIRFRQINELRNEIVVEIVAILTDRLADDCLCCCDGCVLAIMESKGFLEKYLRGLALVGMEYLLDKNFNGAAALSYYNKHLASREGNNNDLQGD